MKNPSALKHATDSVRGSREIVLETCEKSPVIVEFAAESLRFDKEFAVEAVARNASVLWHLPRKVQRDPAVIVATLAKSGSLELRPEVEPIMGYFSTVLESSRKAVTSIRREERAAREEEALVADKHISILERELDSLQLDLDKEKERNCELLDRCAAYEAAAAAESPSVPSKKKMKVEDDEQTKEPDPFVTSWEKDVIDTVDTKTENGCHLTTNALHLQCLTVSALKAKVEELARLAVEVGASAEVVEKIKSRPLGVATPIECSR